VQIVITNVQPEYKAQFQEWCLQNRISMTAVLWTFVLWLLKSELTFDQVMDALPRAEQIVKLRASLHDAIADDQGAGDG
jgi:hypothetical protein